MPLLELLYHWLFTKLSPQNGRGYSAAPRAILLVNRPYPAPAASSAMCRRARSARFNYPPKQHLKLR